MQFRLDPVELLGNWLGFVDCVCPNLQIGTTHYKNAATGALSKFRAATVADIFAYL